MQHEHDYIYLNNSKLWGCILKYPVYYCWVIRMQNGYWLQLHREFSTCNFKTPMWVFVRHLYQRRSAENMKAIPHMLAKLVAMPFYGNVAKFMQSNSTAQAYFIFPLYKLITSAKGCLKKLNPKNNALS